LHTVAIVGTGLIGASFGLALRQAGFTGTLLGVSSDRAVADAVAAGAIGRGLPLAEAAAQADLIFLSQEISRILDTIRFLDPFLRPEALVTDAGSTKTEIVAAAGRHIRRAQFLGGHPMAGKEQRGASAADGKLFEGRTWVLTPTEPSELETAPATEFRAWLDRIGARQVVLDSARHDSLVAITSHLAQLASTALASTVLDAIPDSQDLRVAGTGLSDMTRLALSSYELWRDILATNTEAIDRALSLYIQKIEHLRENLRTRELHEEFTRAQELAARLRRPI
jgi:prephenate dehydrogenase